MRPNLGKVLGTPGVKMRLKLDFSADEISVLIYNFLNNLEIFSQIMCSHDLISRLFYRDISLPCETTLRFNVINWDPDTCTF